MALPAVPPRLVARPRRDLGEDAVRVEGGRLVVTPGTAAEARLVMRGVPVRVDPVRLNRLVQVDLSNRRIVPAGPGRLVRGPRRAVRRTGPLGRRTGPDPDPRA